VRIVQVAKAAFIGFTTPSDVVGANSSSWCMSFLLHPADMMPIRSSAKEGAEGTFHSVHNPFSIFDLK